MLGVTFETWFLNLRNIKSVLYRVGKAIGRGKLISSTPLSPNLSATAPQKFTLKGFGVIVQC